jgi:hypothetical protein
MRGGQAFQEQVALVETTSQIDARLGDRSIAMHTKADRTWTSLGVTSEFLEATGAWLGDQRELHDQSALFFQMAGSLISLARFDYLLCSPAFFQGVFGLERALKLHYDADDTCRGKLLSRAVQESLVHDGLFKNNDALSKELVKKYKVKGMSNAERLALIIPNLRNQFVHGTYLLHPEFLRLTIHLREMADALTTKRMLPIR